MALQSAPTDQSADQRGTALDLQVIVVIDVLQCLIFQLNDNAIHQPNQNALLQRQLLVSNKQISP